MTSDRQTRIRSALIGAYVADAAALGFHWLYDPDRLAELAGGSSVFREPDPADFEGFKGVFVHPGKRAGQISHYGWQMRVALQSFAAQGGLDVRDYQDRFQAAFGGDGNGHYIDKATKGTLENLAAGQRSPSGADDDQPAAMVKLPPLMVFNGADVDAAITVTNANDTALAYARPAAAMLAAAYDGAKVPDCLAAGIAAAESDVAAALQAAIDSPETDSVVFAGQVGRACPLPQSMPVIFHIAARADTYADAVERNTRAAGDNCGRAPVLGALFGACHGIGASGVPQGWMDRIEGGEELFSEIDQMVSQAA